MLPIRFTAGVILRKWYVITALVIVTLAAVVRLHANVMPEPVAIPTPVMPSPNARDYYTAAEALERDGTEVDFAVSPPIALAPGQDHRLAADPLSGYHAFTLAEKDKLVAENLPAIAKLHEGMKYAYMQHPDRSFDAVFPYFARDRAMARLLSLEGQTKAAHGDWPGAMDAYLDCIRIGSDLPHGAMLIGMLVGIACEEIGRKNAGDAIDRLTSSQARADADRLAKIDANEEPVSQTLQEEERFTQVALDKAFANPRWRTLLVSDGNGDSNTSDLWALGYFALHAESPKTAFDNYTRYMNEVVAQSKLPWPAQHSAVPPVMPTDPVNKILLPIIAQASFKQFASIALGRLLETQLALRAYKLDHGSYPDGLAHLVPGYLPAMPLDPFTDGKPLRYRLNGDKYLLYSVGPDATDDGGRPMYDPTRSVSRYSSMWSPDEKGDIVAGVND